MRCNIIWTAAFGGWGCNIIWTRILERGATLLGGFMYFSKFFLVNTSPSTPSPCPLPCYLSISFKPNSPNFQKLKAEE